MCASIPPMAGQECYCGEHRSFLWIFTNVASQRPLNYISFPVANSLISSTSPSTGQVASTSDCSTTCAGDSSQKCGGGNRLSIYTYSAPLPSGWTSVGCFTDATSNRYGYPGLQRGDYSNTHLSSYYLFHLVGRSQAIAPPRQPTRLDIARRSVLERATNMRV